MSRGFTSKIRVRVKRKWRGYKPGDVINPPAAMRQILIQKDVVEPVEEPVPAVENDVRAAPAPELDFGGDSQRRPRPRKKDSE